MVRFTQTSSVDYCSLPGTQLLDATTFHSHMNVRGVTGNRRPFEKRGMYLMPNKPKDLRGPACHLKKANQSAAKAATVETNSLCIG